MIPEWARGPRSTTPLESALRLRLGHRRLGALEPDLRVGPVAERLVRRPAAAAERELGLAAEVDLDAGRIVELAVPLDEVGTIGSGTDGGGHGGFDAARPRGIHFRFDRVTYIVS